jgi:hypothetical protein
MYEYNNADQVLSIRKLRKVMQPLAITASPPTNVVSSALILSAFSLHETLSAQIISARAEL